MANSSLKMNTPLGFFLLFGLSAMGIALVYGSLYPQAPDSIKTAMLFYAPAWMFTNALFGGPQNASPWSYWPSIVLAVVGQNVLLWKLFYWLRTKMR
jgi:hypothetical protein